jgi:hypothetical protein
VTEDKNRMRPSDREGVEAQLLAEVRAFLDELERRSPTLDDGEECALTFRGARCGFTQDDYPLFSFGVKHTREENL